MFDDSHDLGIASKRLPHETCLVYVATGLLLMVGCIAEHNHHGRLERIRVEVSLALGSLTTVDNEFGGPVNFFNFTVIEPPDRAGFEGKFLVDDDQWAMLMRGMFGNDQLMGGTTLTDISVPEGLSGAQLRLAIRDAIVEKHAK